MLALTSAKAVRTSGLLLGLAGATIALPYLPVAAQTPSVRDSVGVRIVQNTSREHAPVTLHLGNEPVFDLGGPEEDPAIEFDAQNGTLYPVRLSNGNIAVIDKNRVQYFDALGKRLQIVGRSGAGPEEFGWLTGICRTRGDTIVVRDERNARLAVLDGDGKIVRTIRYQALGMPDTHHCFDDGTLALALRSAWRDPGQAGTQQITRVRLDGSPVNEIGRFETPPYDPLTSMFLHVRASGQRLYVGDPRTGEVRVYTPAGKLATIIRSADRPVRIPRDMIEAQMKRNLPTAPVARLSAAQYWPTWPAYRDLQIDARGTLWVEDFSRDILKPHGWTAFDTQGRLVGRLIIPAPAKGEFPVIVRAVSADQIMIWRMDQDHFPHLTLFPLLRGSAGGR